MKHSCTFCDFSCNKERDLQRRARVHRHRCSSCDEVFTTQPLLQAHISAEHRRTPSTQTEPRRPRACSSRRQHHHRGQRYTRPRQNRRLYWRPARNACPTLRHEVESKIVRPPVDPIRNDSDPLGRLNSPVKIDL